MRSIAPWLLVALAVRADAAPGRDTPPVAGDVTVPPNIVLIVADDLGFGDPSCYGAGTIRTPSIDRVADEGIRLTFYNATSPVCSPSRAAMLTGRHPVRTGVLRAIGPESRTGLPPGEITLAEVLRDAGYSTALVGKWHLGYVPELGPASQGFESVLGFGLDHVLYGTAEAAGEAIEPWMLVDRITEAARSYIADHAESPFFLWIAHTLPHVPLDVPPRFRGVSAAGAYGDAVEAVDWSVGEVLEALRDTGVDGRTLLLFTSDNGPAEEGSPGGLRGRKGSTWEGGTRVPFVARWPDRIPAGLVSDAPVSGVDLFPTILAATGTTAPADVTLDGADVLALLTGREQDRPLALAPVFVGASLRAARLGPWKLHVARYPDGFRGGPERGPNPWLVAPELYDLRADPGESWNVAARNGDVVAEIRRRLGEFVRTLPDSLQQRNSVAMSYR